MKNQILKAINKRLYGPHISQKIFEELSQLTAVLELVENFEIKLVNELDVD
jgi:hypothetical protein